MFRGSELRSGPPQTFQLADSTIEITRSQYDDPGVRRLLLTMPEDIRVELLPTKGLSVREFRVRGRQVFWDPPFERIVNPEELDLSGMMLINGEEMPGFRWVENFAGGVELLGLQNWGMPVVHPETGELLPIHGTASNVPVDSVECSVVGSATVIKSTFTVRDGISRDAQDSGSWYERGTPLWEVARTVKVSREPEIAMTILDTITNRSDMPGTPDWGYHIQFRPEDGARMVIPSGAVSVRGGGDLPQDFEVWRGREATAGRQERGYIHKGCPAHRRPDLGRVINGEVRYREGARVGFSIPAAPYVLSWFSSGGTGCGEFALPEDPGTNFMKKPWDGLGPEIGASALDHDGDVDPSVPIPILQPGEKTTLGLEFTPRFS